MPVSGTFEINGAHTVLSKSAPGAFTWGGDVYSGQSATRATDNASLLEGINSTIKAVFTEPQKNLYGGWKSLDGVPYGEWLIQFSFGLVDVISLDGAPKIDYNTLPSGILIDSATLKVTAYTYSSGDVGVGAGLFLRRDAFRESANLGQNTSFAVPVVKEYVYDLSPSGTVNFSDVLLDGFGIRVVFATVATGGQGFYDVKITGTYIITGWSITFTTNLNAGDEVTITNSEEEVPEIKDIYLTTTVDGELIRTLATITFISVDGRTIRVRLPRALADNGTDKLVVVTFTGEIPLSVLSSQLVDGSGIYKLTPNKTDDTYYDRTDPADTTTIDMKIPCPFIRTGFF